MDERSWILALPPGADTLHEELVAATSPSEPAEKASTPLKRAAEGEPEDGDDFEKKSPMAKRPKRINVAEAITKGRPILHDLLNDTQ